MRIILIVLAVVLILLQLRLWQEVREVRALREMVEQQLAENKALEQRNEALAAEVEDLRAGLEAIEERARSELGLIREDEEFYLIVDPEEVDPEP
ncbi:MAG: cell division protein FtsB [Pseudomonadota bacterium]|nr:MAG: cell division protein FtsB [Pseudomonadota bacterium]